tara:strand:+ start:49285 stop:49755 length:471 start_codon:yes stop_codon:yes gene_type:complete
MQKYIKVFEEFDDLEMKDIQSSSNANWNSIRDCIQSLGNFTIINFKDREGYLNFLNTCKDNCVKQSYYNGFGKGTRKCPSLFINKCLKIEKEDFEKYDLINYLIGRKDKPNIHVKTKDESNIIGNEIVSTLSQDEVFPEDHFKVGSTYYKFINFFS